MQTINRQFGEETLEHTVYVVVIHNKTAKYKHMVSHLMADGTPILFSTREDARECIRNHKKVQPKNYDTGKPVNKVQYHIVRLAFDELFMRYPGGVDISTARVR